MQFPVNRCSYKINHVSTDGAVPHTHTLTSEIIQTFDHEGSILINGKLCKMQKNGLYFIYGPAMHFVAPDDISSYNHTILFLNNAELEKMCKNLNLTPVYEKIFTAEGGTFCMLSPEDVIAVDSILLEITKILQEENDMKYARLCAALTRLFEIGAAYAETENKSNDKISDILSFISDNALNKISIDDICEHTKISKYHLCRIFKENIGITIGEFIKGRRLSVAKRLLMTTNDSITDIAHKCCFTDSSFFSKTFSKEFGLTPSAYRAQYK